MSIKAALLLWKLFVGHASKDCLTNLLLARRKISKYIARNMCYHYTNGVNSP